MEVVGTSGLNTKLMNRNLSVADFLEIAHLLPKDIVDKNITDIGAWLSWLGPYLKKELHAHQVTVVDPVFGMAELKKEMEDTKALLQKDSFDLIKTSEQINETNQQINNLFMEQVEYTPWTRDYDDIGNEIEQLKIWIQHYSVYDNEQARKNNKGYIQTVDDWIFGKNQQYVIINSSPSQDIQGVMVWSQDIVFINHLLHKLWPDDVVQSLKNADALLKPGGKIIIIDYQHNDYRVPLFENTDFIRKQVWIKHWSVCYILSKGDYEIIEKSLATK